MKIKQLTKGAWAPEEDNLLKKCIAKYGEGKWHLVPRRAGLNRCRKSCRLRWLNYLRPNINRGEFAEDEVDLIKRLHKLLGNRWSLIAGRLTGRTANDIKNYWSTNIQRKRFAGPTSRPKEVVESQVLITPELEGKKYSNRRVVKPVPRTLPKGTRVPYQYSFPNNHSPSLNNSPSAGIGIHYTSDHIIEHKPTSTATPSPLLDHDGIEWWKKLLEEEQVESGDLLMLSSGPDLDIEQGLLLTEYLSATTTKSPGTVLESDGQNDWSDIWNFLDADHN